MKSLWIGIVASLFFAVTFVLNRAMDVAGGSWIWSASLRFLLMVPFLLLLVVFRRNLTELLVEMRARPWVWLLWSTIGFGLFYAPICYAAAYGSAWLVAGTWQITIVAGSLLVPLFYEEVLVDNVLHKKRHTIPRKEVLTSLFILIGVALLQVRATGDVRLTDLVVGVLPVLVAAFAYPLGNRKMMSICQGRLDVYQRVLGMTLASLPFWILLAIYGWVAEGLPTMSQTLQSLTVAICSGVIATVLFFYATDRVKDSPRQLAAVEATQAGEVVFAIVGEVLFLGGVLPEGWSLAGLIIIVCGMILHSLTLHKKD